MAATEIEVIRKILKLVDDGRVASDVFTGSLDKIRLTTDKGSGIYASGMLRVEGKIISLNVGNLTDALFEMPKGLKREG